MISTGVVGFELLSDKNVTSKHEFAHCKAMFFFSPKFKLSTKSHKVNIATIDEKNNTAGWVGCMVPFEPKFLHIIHTNYFSLHYLQ